MVYIKDLHELVSVQMNVGINPRTYVVCLTDVQQRSLGKLWCTPELSSGTCRTAAEKRRWEVRARLGRARKSSRRSTLDLLSEAPMHAGTRYAPNSPRSLRGTAVSLLHIRCSWRSATARGTESRSVNRRACDTFVALVVSGTTKLRR